MTYENENLHMLDIPINQFYPIVALLRERVSTWKEIKDFFDKYEFEIHSGSYDRSWAVDDNIRFYLEQYGVRRIDIVQGKYVFGVNAYTIKTINSCILVFPMIFKEIWNTPLSDNEMRILDLIDKEKHVEIIEIVQSVLGKFRKEIQLEKLQKYEGLTVRSKIEKLNNEVNANYMTILNLRIEVNELIERISNLNIEISALEKMPPDAGNSELFEYIVNHENIEVKEVTKDIIDLKVKDILEFDDLDKFWTIYNNPNSNFNSYLRDYPKISYVLRKVCYERKGAVKITQEFSFYRMQTVNISSTDDKDYIPNPHLNYHRCFGDNEASITESLETGNYEGGLERIIASVKNLNWDEWASVKYFLADLISADNAYARVIRIPEIGDVSIEEAYEYFKEQENEQEN